MRGCLRLAYILYIHVFESHRHVCKHLAIRAPTELSFIFVELHPINLPGIWIYLKQLTVMWEEMVGEG